MRLKEFLKDGGSIDSRWDSMSIPERISYIKQDLLKKGYTQNQTAAILGNLLQENTTLKTNTQNTKSGALGIAQWLGSRKTAIINQGKHSTITGQLDFLDKEIKGSAWTNNIGGKKAFFSIDDPAHLTRVFRKDFERPGEAEANDNKRIANAYKVLGLNVPTFNSKEQSPTYNPTSEESTIQPLSIQDTRQFLVDDRGSFQATSPEFGEFIRLENEKTQQEQKAKEAELRNQKIQAEIEQKSAERNQLISMIPQAQYVGSQYTQPQQFKQGGNTSDEEVYQTYERITGKPWVTAKEEGLTDGSYSKNMELQKALLESEKQNDNETSINKSNKELSNTSNITDNINQKTDLKEQYGYDAATDSYGEYQIEEVILPKKFKLPIKNQQQAISDYFSAKNAVNMTNTVNENPITNTDVIGDIKNIGKMLYSTIEDPVVKVITNSEDFIQQGFNYIDRRYLDDTEIKTQNIKINRSTKAPNKSHTNFLEDQINMTDINVGNGKAASGIINLGTNKFVSRNRGELDEVQNGKGIAITTFRPMTKDLDNGYKNFKEVLALKKNGSVAILDRSEIKKDIVEAITGTDRMPWEKIEVVKRKGKDYIKVESTPDFNGKVISMGGYNSGIGIGKTDQEYIPIDEANKYSKLIGGKVIIKSGDQQILVSGSFKNMYDAYQELAKKTKQTPQVYKLDNGSFNTTYFKEDDTITTDDLRKHQNRNNKGGHSLILLKNK